MPRALGGLRNKGFRLFLATSKPRVFAERILKHFNLARYFNRIYGSELDGRLADKGDLIAHILMSESPSPGRTLMVGDRIFDVDGGRKNRVMTAAVTYGYSSPEEIAAAGPDMVFDTPAAPADQHLCRGVGNMDQGYADRCAHPVRHAVHGIGADQVE